MKPTSVSQALKLIKSQLEGQFRNLCINGEVSNLSRSSAGHVYFSLIDSDSLLSCALFRMDALRNPIVKTIKNGDQITCSGALGVYTKKGTFQLIVKRLEASGVGDKEKQLKELKQRLASEGLFDITTKKKIPTMAKKVGLITAHGSAAYHDFVKVMKRRSLWMDIIFSPALVQGEQSAPTLRRALEKMISYHLNAKDENKVDVIVITRGGGSVEDLWSFNDEALAWDIFNCPVPIISAVGHEVDFSISDFVADMRCETPTAAAENLTQGQMHIASTLNEARKDLRNQGVRILQDANSKVAKVAPQAILIKLKERLDARQRKLRSLNMLAKLYDFTKYHEYALRLEDHCSGLMRYSKNLMSLGDRLEKNNEILKALGPHNILKRGYTFIKYGEKVIGRHQEFKKIKKGERLSVFFADGDDGLLK